MKKYLLLSALFFSFALTAQVKHKSITINGECTRIHDGEKLYLFNNGNIIDSVIVSEGKFNFNTMNLQPDEYVLLRKNKGEKNDCLLLYLDYVDTYVKLSDDIEIFYNTNFIKSTIKNNSIDSVVKEVNKLIIQAKDDKVFNSEELKSKFITISKRHDFASLFVLWKYAPIVLQNNMESIIEDVMKNTTEEVLNTPIGAKFIKTFKGITNTIAPDFTLYTLENEAITLSDFVKNKNIILLDFWASWCAPCRKEGENIKEIFNEFKNNGFDVLGVSLDENKEKWREAIENDNIQWTQVSDLLGWKSPIPELYKFSGIPTIIIIDKNRNIIARDIRGAKLKEKIKELCK